ncbi:MAG: 2-isopropylmalate synthase [Eubacterium sp.]|jgi:2-isopropylmalate synthase|nr:2-isopropylmalate synthase [Eubacterium sp.]
MKNASKYKKHYFMPPNVSTKWIKKHHLEKVPAWCSVDLRDGNQALVVPMSLSEKLDFFNFLVKIGFKEIEIGFPAASETEYEFCRRLIEDGLIPDDVAIQVLTQSREHIIDKTFKALEGAKNSVVHLYNSTSLAQREQVFKKSKQEIIDIAVLGANLLKERAKSTFGNFRFEYSPESFTGTEVEFALEICNEVLKIWEPSPENQVIINLPGTVELSLPHVYASQVEYMCDNLYKRENVIVSLHPHNDRGCAVADAELGLLAGAQRVEGTLFGNGERTGNADIITLALNLYSHGVDPELDFEDILKVAKFYEDITDMRVHQRHPYAGELVFAAFSGSHQDAIAKGMEWREQKGLYEWSVPYLPIDPKDIGRQYDGDVIRINSQSGKGGVGYLIKEKYGIDLPKKLREEVGYIIKDASDKQHKELLADEVYDIFYNNFINVSYPLAFADVRFVQNDAGFETANLTVRQKGKERIFSGKGNGPLDAVVHALRNSLGVKIDIASYSEHSLQNSGSSSEALSFMEIRDGNGRSFWGVGRDTNSTVSPIYALFSALNRSGLIN